MPAADLIHHENKEHWLPPLTFIFLFIFTLLSTYLGFNLTSSTQNSLFSYLIFFSGIIISFLSSFAIYLFFSKKKLAGNLSSLQSKTASYNSLLHHIPDVILTADEQGNPTYVSQNVETILSFPAQEILSWKYQNWLEHILAEDLSNFKTAYEALFQKNKIFDVTYSFKKKDGNFILIHHRCLNTYTKDGKKYGDSILSDITKQKTQDTELKKRSEDLERVNQTMIGREVRMAQLKKEMETLRKKLQFYEYIKGEKRKENIL